MKFYVEELPEHYWECPFVKNDHERGMYCKIENARCERFHLVGCIREDADPKECLCLKVFPKMVQTMEEGTWP